MTTIEGGKEASLVEALMFHGRHASETERECVDRKNAEREKAAAEITRLTEERDNWRSRAAERDAECERRFKSEYVAKAEATLLRDALRPFAEACAHLHPSQPDNGETLDGFKVRDFRRAAQALSSSQGGGG